MAVSSSLRYRLRDALSSIPLANELADIINSALEGLSTTGLADLASTVAGKGASLIGVEAGSLGDQTPANVQAAFAAVLSGLGEKLSTSKLVHGSATVLAAGTSITAVVGADYNGKQVIVTPAGSPGLSTQWYGSIAGGTLTVTVITAPGADTVFNYLILDL